MALTAAFRIPDPPVTSSYGASQAVRPGNKNKKKKPYVVTDFFDPNNIPARAATRPVASGTTAPPITTSLADATGNPWDAYLAQMDAREAAARDEEIRARAASSRNYMASLAGFGQALQGSAADAWQKILGSYNEGAAALTGAQAGLAGQFGEGLTAGQGQMNADQAALNSGGGAGVDANAAQQQVATVGGADPGGTLGLVGRSWEGYGETVPGNVGFMTEQNIAQAGREGMAAEDEIRARFAAEMANNPEAAMAMWQNVQQYDLAKQKQEADLTQAEIANKYAAAKNQREENAAALLYQKFLADQGKDAWSIAKDMTNFTGTVWGVDKKGKPYDTGAVASGSRAGTAATAAATSKANSVRTATTAANRLEETKAHNQEMETQGLKRIGISRANSKLSREREARIAAGGKNAPSVSDKRQWANKAAQIAYNAFYGTPTPNPNYDPSKKEGPDNPKKITKTSPPKAALHAMIAADIPYSIAWNAIYQFAIQAGDSQPNWRNALSWNPQYDSPAQRERAKKEREDYRKNRNR